MTTIGTWPMNLPIIPSICDRGRKAKTVVSTAMITGTATSRVPSMAAAVRLMPRSRRVKTFSPTTIASSTTMPSTTMKANIEIMFSEAPQAGMIQNPPMKEIGMPMATQKARRGCRKRARQMKTSTRPIVPFFSIRFMRLR